MYYVNTKKDKMKKIMINLEDMKISRTVFPLDFLVQYYRKHLHIGSAAHTQSNLQ